MSRPSRWRLIVDRPADGAWNMAVDEALLESCVAGTHPTSPTLRLYAWRPAALSLGRSQRSNGACDAAYLRQHGIDLVRRPTGGTAVLHEYERTYAVIARLRSPPFSGSVGQTYAEIARALGVALRRLGLDARATVGEVAPGPPRRRDAGAACFGSRSNHEISVDGRKLVGSAQLRRRCAFLQHGSILLRADPARLAHAIGLREPPGGYTDLSRELGRHPLSSEVDRVLVDAFSETFSADLEAGELTPRETEHATRLRSFKYHSREWTLEGRLRLRRGTI